MIFTLQCVSDSLAGVLKAGYPDYPVYGSPVPQGADPPCFFIFFMPSTIEGQVDERYMRDLGVDIVFVQERCIVDGNARILEVAEYLDGALELFPYHDGSGGTALVRTFERQWKIEDGELHYQSHIKQRVAVPRDTIRMQEMEENDAKVKKGKEG